MMTQTEHYSPGGDPRALADYRALRAEMTKLTHPARPDVHWAQVETLARRLWETHGVDLQTAAWHTLARLHLAGLTGLNAALAQLQTLTARHGSALWPLNTRARQKIFTELARQLQAALRICRLATAADLRLLQQTAAQVRVLAQTLKAQEACHDDSFAGLLQQIEQTARRLRNALQAAPAATEATEEGSGTGDEENAAVAVGPRSAAVAEAAPCAPPGKARAEKTPAVPLRAAASLENAAEALPAQTAASRRKTASPKGHAVASATQPAGSDDAAIAADDAAVASSVQSAGSYDAAEAADNPPAKASVPVRKPGPTDPGPTETARCAPPAGAVPSEPSQAVTAAEGAPTAPPRRPSARLSTGEQTAAHKAPRSQTLRAFLAGVGSTVLIGALLLWSWTARQPPPSATRAGIVQLQRLADQLAAQEQQGQQTIALREIRPPLDAVLRALRDPHVDTE